MDTIANLKELAVTQTPLLLFDVTLANGEMERWATHGVTVDAESYAARVLRHNLFEVQAASEHGIDAIPKISLTLANADSELSQIESSVGFKGAKIQATFLFYDLVGDEPASEAMVVFQGILNPPEQVTEETLRVTAVNRMSMQRVLLPPVRLERRCPWTFPSTTQERQEAINGGAEGAHSRFFRCGYSAGEPGGVGNLDGGSPFTSCGFTRPDCMARGMFDVDELSNPTRRFGGVEFVPATVRVRSSGAREFRDSPATTNEARYNDFIPLAYGTVWAEPPVVFARNDGNLTRMEVLLGLSKITQVQKVIVNNIEVPIGINGRDMTGSGWWNLFTDGGRTGGFNLNFTRPDGSPLGDPYGSMACLSVVVPNQIYSGSDLPRVKVLVEGLQVEVFDAGGGSLGTQFTNNPVWCLLDVLRRSGWRVNEIDLLSFADAAAFCDETIAATDNQGNPISVKRFQCNMLVRARRTAADVIRGIRNTARLQLTYRSSGKLAVYVENTLALQQSTKPEGSNSPEMVNGGWPAYVYADGSAPGVGSGILRRPDGSAAFRMWSRSMADTPNRFSVEFADAFNEYQQDSLALVDAEDIQRAGQEISGNLVATGLPTFDQAARILKFFLDRSLRGNRYIEFETSVKGFGQQVGDLITVTYNKEGFLDQPFRILKIEPAENYRSVNITAQLHDDAWYNDTNGQLSLIPPTRREPEPVPTVPDSLFGHEYDEFGIEQFSVTEYAVADTDGTILAEVEVQFHPPRTGRSLALSVPLVSLQPTIETTGGTIEGDQTLYYAVTANDGNGDESNRSFVVRAKIPAGTSTNVVQIGGLSFHPEAVSFNVYRGDLPTRLFQIAAAQTVAGTFDDTGLVAVLEGAPDPNYDHANFYWRLEDTDEQFASSFGPDSVGSSVLAMSTNALVGHAVRLLRGKGAGQEREVTSNTATTLFVTPDWEIEPDESTIFVVSGGTWHFAGRAKTSPARFAIPNRRDKVLQITGRAANAQNIESLEGLAVVTRWRIGGGGLGVADHDVPPEPTFGAAVHGDGTLELGVIGFPLLENTQGVTSGTFRLFVRDELAGVSSTLLAAAIDDTETSLTLSEAGSAQVGDLVQVESEILRVTDVLSGGTVYVVERGQYESPAASHGADTPLYHLQARTIVTPFERSFFGTPAGATWTHSEWMPDVRLACAELWMTNAFGQSPVAVNNYSMVTNFGLRTLRGGQFSFQVEGGMAVLTDVVPTVSVQEDLSIRDIYASVKQAPEGADLELEIRQDGLLLAPLTIAATATVSTPVDGAELPVLQALSNLSLNITAVGTTFPGRDLTVTIRV
jgi:Putative phage tail protein